MYKSKLGRWLSIFLTAAMMATSTSMGTGVVYAAQSDGNEAVVNQDDQSAEAGEISSEDMDETQEVEVVTAEEAVTEEAEPADAAQQENAKPMEDEIASASSYTKWSTVEPPEGTTLVNVHITKAEEVADKLTLCVNYSGYMYELDDDECSVPQYASLYAVYEEEIASYTGIKVVETQANYNNTNYYLKAKENSLSNVGYIGATTDVYINATKYEFAHKNFNFTDSTGGKFKLYTTVEGRYDSEKNSTVYTYSGEVSTTLEYVELDNLYVVAADGVKAADYNISLTSTNATGSSSMSCSCSTSQSAYGITLNSYYMTYDNLVLTATPQPYLEYNVTIDNKSSGAVKVYSDRSYNEEFTGGVLKSSSIGLKLQDSADTSKVYEVLNSNGQVLFYLAAKYKSSGYVYYYDLSKTDTITIQPVGDTVVIDLKDEYFGKTYGVYYDDELEKAVKDGDKVKPTTELYVSYESDAKKQINVYANSTKNGKYASGERIVLSPSNNVGAIRVYGDSAKIYQSSSYDLLPVEFDIEESLQDKLSFSEGYSTDEYASLQDVYVRDSVYVKLNTDIAEADKYVKVEFMPKYKDGDTVHYGSDEGSKKALTRQGDPQYLYCYKNRKTENLVGYKVKARLVDYPKFYVEESAAQYISKITLNGTEISSGATVDPDSSVCIYLKNADEKIYFRTFSDAEHTEGESAIIYAGKKDGNTPYVRVNCDDVYLTKTDYVLFGIPENYSERGITVSCTVNGKSYDSLSSNRIPIGSTIKVKAEGTTGNRYGLKVGNYGFIGSDDKEVTFVINYDKDLSLRTKKKMLLEVDMSSVPEGDRPKITDYYAEEGVYLANGDYIIGDTYLGLQYSYDEDTETGYNGPFVIEHGIKEAGELSSRLFYSDCEGEFGRISYPEDYEGIPTAVIKLRKPNKYKLTLDIPDGYEAKVESYVSGNDNSKYTAPIEVYEFEKVWWEAYSKDRQPNQYGKYDSENLRLVDKETGKLYESAIIMPARDATFVLQKFDLVSMKVSGHPYWKVESETHTEYDCDNGDEDNKAYKVEPGKKVWMAARNLRFFEELTVNVVDSADNAKVLAGPFTLTSKEPIFEFIAPDKDFRVLCSKAEYAENQVTIENKDFSQGTVSQVRAYVNQNDYLDLVSGDTAREHQKLDLRAASLAENKKLMVTVKNTKNNVIATGSANGTVLDRLKNMVFEMFGYPVSITFTEKAVKGTGKEVYVNDASGKLADVTVNAESGDRVKAGDKVTIDVKNLKEGSTLAISVVCPDENLIASGEGNAVASGSVPGVWEPVLHSYVKADGVYSFEMPDFPVDINIIDADGTSGSTEGMVYDITDGNATVEMKDRVLMNRLAEVKPLPVVKYAGDLLVKDVDYTLTYENNKAVTEAAKVTITGIGSYTGTITKTFAIYVAEANLADAEIVLAQEAYEYTGNAIEPEFTVLYDGAALTAGIDYEYNVANNVNAGTAVINVVGLGNLKGTISKNFTIAPKSFSSKEFKAVVENMAYKSGVSEYKPDPVVTYGGEQLSQGADYTLTYADNTGAQEKATVTITGVNNYAGESVLSFSILKTSLASEKLKVVLKDKSFVYDGTEKQAGIASVSYKGQPLSEADYEVVYTDCVNAGKPAVVIIGRGEYTGKKAIYYKITPKKLTEAEITIGGSEGIADQVFNGDSRPKPVVTDTKLATPLNGSDITFTYKNNRKVGTAAVVITGKGNYTGKLSKNFKIVPMNVEDYDFVVDDQSYTGKAITPPIKAVNKNTGEVITMASKFAFKVKAKSKNVEIGKAEISVSAKKATYFTGDFCQRDISFNIVKCDLSMVEIDDIAPQYSKKGTEIKPKLTIYLQGAKLKSKGISAKYENNTKAGIATVTISPADTAHYEGSQSTTFIIKDKK